MAETKKNQIRINISLANLEEKEIIEKAVAKINKKATNGMSLSLSAFGRNALIEKAKKILQDK